jgi:S-adenosyl methyltransferase
VISHVTGDIRGQSAASASVEYKKIAPDATLSSRGEILRLFAGFELVDPGLAQVPCWRPDHPQSADADRLWIVGRRRMQEELSFRCYLQLENLIIPARLPLRSIDGHADQDGQYLSTGVERPGRHPSIPGRHTGSRTFWC